MKARRWLYLVHRWLGIAMCLLVAMWFFSGVVMMYVGFPSLTQEERLASLPLLQAESVQVGPSALLGHIEAGADVVDFRVTSVLGRPAYMLRTADGDRYGLFADTGEFFAESVSPANALVAAQLYSENQGIESVAGITFLSQIDMDQWSVSSALNSYRPLYLVALNDADDTQLYVSSLTGQVVRDTTAHERFWNWLGANLHWIYPVQLRRHSSVWHWLVVVLSLVGTVSIITGAIVGYIRLRVSNPYRGKNVTPYRGAMKLHHILGLCLTLPLATYMFSGLMSMNPWGVFSDDVPFDKQYAVYRELPPGEGMLEGPSTLAALRQALVSDRDIREVVWQWLGGERYLYSISGDAVRQLIPEFTSSASRENQSEWTVRGVAQLRKVMAGHDIASIERLDTYDSYYYSHHQTWRPLPVLRVQFDDPARTWFHIDLVTGEMLNRLTTTGRVQRWLYNGLHSLDFIFLLNNRPLWDVVVIVLSVGGFVFSVSSVVVGWRRLRKPRRRGRGFRNSGRASTAA